MVVKIKVENAGKNYKTVVNGKVVPFKNGIAKVDKKDGEDLIKTDPQTYSKISNEEEKEILKENATDKKDEEEDKKKQ